MDFVTVKIDSKCAGVRPFIVACLGDKTIDCSPPGNMCYATCCRDSGDGFVCPCRCASRWILGRGSKLNSPGVGMKIARTWGWLLSG